MRALISENPGKKIALAALLGLALSGSWAPVARAANYLVKDQAAYKERMKRLEPGDKLVLANGVWRDFEIVFEAYGREGKPISLMAQTPGRVIISGRSNLRIGGDHLIVHGLTFKYGYSPTKEVISFRRDSKTLANNTRLVETVIDSFNKPDRTVEDHWVALFGKNNRVDHNAFFGKANRGPTLVVRLNTPESRENGHIVDHNYFGRRPPLGGNGGETIRIGVSDYSRTRSETIIARNYFERCDGEVEIISNKSEGNAISENVFYESRGAVVLRHGGNNVVSRNVFFGNGVSDTGGVRVINENQTVTENYFEGLRGRKFLSALTIMNGVPNSPINRYHQVQNANVSENTFVDIASIGFAVGSDEERSAPPIASAFRDNLIITDTEEPVSVFDDITGIEFGGNVSNNSALESYGATIDAAIELDRAENGLLYLRDNDKWPAAGAPRDLNPVKRDATGPSWYEKPHQSPGESRSVKVSKSVDMLTRKLAEAKDGETLALAGARYVFDEPIVIDRTVSIAAKSADERPSLSSSGEALFELRAGGKLTLNEVDVIATDQNQAVFAARGEKYEGAYALSLKNVAIKHEGAAADASFLHADPATFAEAVHLDTVTLRHWNGPFISMSGAGLDGWYLADDIVIKNSTFENVAGPLVAFGREGRDESTFGPRFTLKNSRLRSVGREGAAITLDGVDGLKVNANEFVDSGAISIRQRVLGLPFSFDKNILDNTPLPDIRGVDGAAIAQGEQGQ